MFLFVSNILKLYMLQLLLTSYYNWVIYVNIPVDLMYINLDLLLNVYVF